MSSSGVVNSAPPLQKSNGISFCIFFEFQTLRSQVPGISTIPNIVFSAPKLIYLQCRLDVFFFWAKAREMETWSYIWQHRAFKYFISLGLHNSQMGQWCKPYCSYFQLSNQKERRLNGLLNIVQLVWGRAGIRMEVFWLLVQGSPNWILEVKVALWVSVL